MAVGILRRLLQYQLLLMVIHLPKIPQTSSEEEAECIFETGFDNFSSWESEFIPPSYTQSSPPRREGSKASVMVGIFPMGIPDMNVEKMTLEVDFYLSLVWSDCRLKALPPELTTLPLKLSNHIWTPSVIIANGVGTKPMKFDPQNQQVGIAKGVSFYYYTRNNVHFYCKYDLSAYPMDKQRCELQIIPEKDQNLIEVKHLPLPVYAAAVKGRAPPQCVITEVGKGNCTSTDMFSSEFSCVALYIVLERAFSFHLIVTYVPSTLIVILSWVSFWLDVEASAPRVTLGLTSLLTLSTQFSNIQNSLPPVSYIKAVDVWMFACMFMVFASLLQFAVTNFHFRKNKVTIEDIPIKTSEKSWKPNFQRKVYAFQADYKQNKPYCPPGLKRVPKVEEPEKNQKISLMNIDKYSRILFPLFFLTFNIIYWRYYLRFYD